MAKPAITCLASFFMLLIGLLGLCRGTLADDCTNVTIANAADAEAVRKSCRVIQGDLVFADTLSESINLDGVETVLGGIRHDGSCGRISGCPYVSPFTISSSTLTRVNQTMYFWYFPGLEKLILPSLVTVDGGFMLKRLHNLTHLDITGLSYVGWVVLETPRLKTLLLDGLKGFTGIEGNGDVGIWDAGEIESVDGFFRNPIDPYPYFTPPGSAVESGLGITGSAIPNVREVNIGWTRISTLTISGKNLTVVLGGPSTKSMEIGKLELMSGVTDLKRSPGLKNLTLTTFFMENNPNMTHLRADFDQVANFTVYAYDSLRALEFPPQAVNWVNLSLHLNHGRSSPLNLSSEHTVDASGQRRKTWYWPERDMREVVIRGNLATDFFQSFLDYRAENKDPSNRPRVLERFNIWGESSALKLNCSAFDELQKTGALPADYSCYDAAAASARGRMMQQPWQLGLLALGLSASFL